MNDDNFPLPEPFWLNIGQGVAIKIEQMNFPTLLVPRGELRVGK